MPEDDSRSGPRDAADRTREEAAEERAARAGRRAAWRAVAAT